MSSTSSFGSGLVLMIPGDRKALSRNIIANYEESLQFVIFYVFFRIKEECVNDEVILQRPEPQLRATFCIKKHEL